MLSWIRGARSVVAVFCPNTGAGNQTSDLEAKAEWLGSCALRVESLRRMARRGRDAFRAHLALQQNGSGVAHAPWVKPPL